MIGLLRKALGKEWENDAGKWVNRVKVNRDKVQRCWADLNHAQATGKPVKTAAGYLEDCWKRFR